MPRRRRGNDSRPDSPFLAATPASPLSLCQPPNPSLNRIPTPGPGTLLGSDCVTLFSNFYMGNWRQLKQQQRQRGHVSTLPQDRQPPPPVSPWFNQHPRILPFANSWAACAALRLRQQQQQQQPGYRVKNWSSVLYY